MAFAYSRNTESVVSESFEDDTVLINFEKGTYFSLQGSAQSIWDCLEAPATLETIADMIGATTPETLSELQRFLDVLFAEGCLSRSEMGEAQSLLRRPADAALEYVPPVITVYHDLKEIIVIDPIHDVDDFDAWPGRPAPFTAG